MLIFYLRLQNFEDFSVDRLIYNLSGALPSELDWQQERGSRKQSPSAITCRHQKELVNNYYQATIIISCNNYYRLQQCGKSRNIYALCYVLKYKHWLCCLFLDVLWISSQNLRVKLEMTSAVWGGEREAWRAAESWRVKSYGLPSHSHLSKPIQQAEMGISEASYANFKYWILIILWLHQKIPPAIYILPSLRKTMHLNSHRPTTRDRKVWKFFSFWHLAASGKNHGYHHHDHDQGYPR